MYIVVVVAGSGWCCWRAGSTLLVLLTTDSRSHPDDSPDQLKLLLIYRVLFHTYWGYLYNTITQICLNILPLIKGIFVHILCWFIFCGTLLYISEIKMHPFNLCPLQVQTGSSSQFQNARDLLVIYFLK